MDSITSTPSPLSNHTYGSAYNTAPATGAGSFGSLPLDPRRLRRRSVWSSVAGLLLAFALLAVIGVVSIYAYIAWVLARPDVAPLQSDPARAVGLAYEDISFFSDNGDHRLDGWYIPVASVDDPAKHSAKTIVFSHGYGGNREEIWVPIYELARFAHEQGYNALMFDYGYVYNDDRVVTGGAKESSDLIGAVRYAKSRGADEVVVWGFSMGAGTALQAALRTGDIDAMILDSTFVLEPDTLYHNLKQYADLPREPSLTLLRWLYPLVNGSGLGDVPYQKIKNTAYDVPTLMIHGTLDERSPYDIIRGIARNQTAANEASEFWLVPNATHELVYRKDKPEYISRATAFLERVASE
ncbi:alpha/beta hydrolase [Paenibacillus sp.]|uniref:alpha/beta hydrolase n=1 Tax=Paenibacillus sp. TaxID=58172 RepID=UPI002D4359F0|nr:alpha/beta hydrolase [Paenibacillus sp.]HZG55185.1 alpha/beta hydrolase [Paenibacillus sp.]